jgi:hypothetical protein
LTPAASRHYTLPHRMLLSPSEMGVAPSSHFPEMKSLNNSTRPDHFSSMTPSPLPPPPYKKRQEPHNPPPHPLSSFLWFSLVQAPTLTELKSSSLPLLVA